MLLEQEFVKGSFCGTPRALLKWLINMGTVAENPAMTADDCHLIEVSGARRKS